MKTAERALDVIPLKPVDRTKRDHAESLPRDRREAKRSESTARSADFTRSDEGYFGGAMTATLVRELDACDQIMSRLRVGGSRVVFSRDDNADRKQRLRPSSRLPTSSNQEHCLFQSGQAVARQTWFAT